MELLPLRSQDLAVRKTGVVHHAHHVARTRASRDGESALELENINVIEVVVVLAIEAPKDYHAAAHEASRVSSPGLG